MIERVEGRSERLDLLEMIKVLAKERGFVIRLNNTMQISQGENSVFRCSKYRTGKEKKNPYHDCPFKMSIKKDYSIKDAKFMVANYTSEHNHALIIIKEKQLFNTERFLIK